MKLKHVLDDMNGLFDADRLVSFIFVTDGFHRTPEEVRGVVMHRCNDAAAEPFVYLFGCDFSQQLQEIESVPDYMIDRQGSLNQMKQLADTWLINQLGETKPIFVSSGYYEWTADICKNLDWHKEDDAIDLRQLYSAYTNVADVPAYSALENESLRAFFNRFPKPPKRFGLKAIEDAIRGDYISIGCNPVCRARNTSSQAITMLMKDL